MAMISGSPPHTPDAAAAGADAFLTPQLLERRDGLAEELAEPRLPFLFFDGRVGEARCVSSPGVLQCALLVLRAVRVPLIRHVVLQGGVAGLALLLARGGDAGVRAGRLLLG